MAGDLHRLGERRRGEAEAFPVGLRAIAIDDVRAAAIGRPAVGVAGGGAEVDAVAVRARTPGRRRSVAKLAVGGEIGRAQAGVARRPDVGVLPALLAQGEIVQAPPVGMGCSRPQAVVDEGEIGRLLGLEAGVRRGVVRLVGAGVVHAAMGPGADMGPHRIAERHEAVDDPVGRARVHPAGPGLDRRPARLHGGGVAVDAEVVHGFALPGRGAVVAEGDGLEALPD